MARETANQTVIARRGDEDWLYEQPEQVDIPANQSHLMSEAIDKPPNYPEDGR